ncbi:hypothetical protein E2P81_ATG02990 [Venturia nashicola]|nr:hypothetical protein E2P81_ATG02990 [Venturia nashicola]
MKYALILGFAALAVALPQYEYSNGGYNSGGRGSYDDRRGGRNDYGRGGNSYGNNYGPSGVAGSIAGEISYDISKDITKGITHGIENGIECAFHERYRCKNVAGEEVPVPENLKEKSDIVPRQFFGNLIGGNRPGLEAEEDAPEPVETEIETDGESIPVLELQPGQAAGFTPEAAPSVE